MTTSFRAGETGARWIVATTAAVATGVVLNWGWLLAVGVAPLILSVLPCLVMCALGLCVRKLFGSRASSRTQADSGEASARQVTKCMQ